MVFPVWSRRTAQSPDLNPIQQDYDEVKHQVGARPYTNIFTNALVSELEQITDFISCCIDAYLFF